MGSFAPFLFTLLLGITGALIALVLRFPIPWMLGSLIICAVGSFAGLPVKTLPGVLERWMRVVIGVSLGPSVALSLTHSVTDLPFAIVAAIAITTLTVVLGTHWFERQASLPRPTAFMSALPGGLSMLLALAGDIGHRPQVMLVHAVRVVIVVVSISLLARVLGVPVEASPLMSSLVWSNDTSPWLLAGLIIVCFGLAEKLKMAGSHVIIPMFVTALLVGLGDVNLTPPPLVNTIALLVFGIVIGFEVANGPRDRYRLLFQTSSVFTIAVMAMGALFAVVLTRYIDHGFLVLFLALAPGGIAEVSLVALALGLDAGMVALVHSCRFLYIITLGPVGLRVLDKKQGTIN